MTSNLTRGEFLKLAGATAALALLPKSYSFYLWGLKDALQTEQLPANFEHLAGPLKQSIRQSGIFQSISWEEALAGLADVFRRFAPSEIAFLIGQYPDHLNHLVQLLAQALGGARVLRFSPQSEHQGQVTLRDAAQHQFGLPQLPLFDLSKCKLVYSFGASFDEPWVAAESAVDAEQPNFQRASGCRFVHLSARRPAGLRSTDEWIPIRPGSEAILASAMVKLLSDKPLDLRLAAKNTGVSARTLIRLARQFAQSPQRVAIPGAAGLSTPDGQATAQAILALNLLDTSHTPHYSIGSLFLIPGSPLYPHLPSCPATAAEMGGLAQSIRSGQVKALLVHNADPLLNLPAAYRWKEALEALEQIVYLSPRWSSAAGYADLIIPDLSEQESTGYQLSQMAADLSVVHAIQPIKPARLPARSTVNVLLGAVQLLGGYGLPGLSFASEAEFLRDSLAGLNVPGGEYTAQKAGAYSTHFLQKVSWMRKHPVRFPPVSFRTPAETVSDIANLSRQEGLQLLIYPVETIEQVFASLHPLAARKLRLKGGDQVRVSTEFGAICLPLTLQPGLHPEALAIPWPMNAPTITSPLDLIGQAQNVSGGMVFAGLGVRIERID